jgi:hypothetical protein
MEEEKEGRERKKEGKEEAPAPVFRLQLIN